MSPFAEQLTGGSFFDFLMDILRAIASIRTPFLDLVMQGITAIGQEMVLIVIAMFMVWCLDKKWGYRFLAIFMVGSILNQILKAVFLIPRPWVIDPEFEIVESARAEATGFSFPSAHTQNVTMTFGAIAMWLKKKWIYILAVIISLLVAFSRMYLGVHTLLDTSVGLIAGLLVLIVMDVLMEHVINDPKRFGIFIALGNLATLCFLLYLYLAPVSQYLRTEDYKNAFVLFGTTFGFTIGWIIDLKWGHFETKAVWWMQLIKLVLGMIIVLTVRTVLKAAFGGSGAAPIFHGIRYAVMTVVAIGVCPLLFKPLVKWSEKITNR